MSSQALRLKLGYVSKICELGAGQNSSVKARDEKNSSHLCTGPTVCKRAPTAMPHPRSDLFVPEQFILPEPLVLHFSSSWLSLFAGAIAGFAAEIRVKEKG